jgi:hypothetical protein
VFGAETVTINGLTTLTFTLTNPNAFVFAGVVFGDVLPAGLLVATPNGLTGSCDAGTITAVAGSGVISLSGATLAANTSCTFAVNVTGVTEGTQVNQTSSVASTSFPGTVVGAFATATITVIPPGFLIKTSSNLTNGDSLINITNTGENGAPLHGPGFGGAAGNICVNVYAFSPDEQLISCCSCLVTPNGLVNLTANRDLVSNTLTGIRPNSIVVKLLATAAGLAFTGSNCANSAAVAGTAAFPLASGVLAWGTTLHSKTSVDPPPAGTLFSITETPFSQATLNPGELASITNRCTNIIGNGSGFGICRSCRQGGLGGEKQ